MLESKKHGDSAFVTLTYDEKHVPSDCLDEKCRHQVKGTLCPKDAQDWLKRLRFALSPAKIRFFLAGEYGDETWRPQYHAAVFGLSSVQGELVSRTWGMGHTLTGELTPESAAYIAGYVTKKMTSKEDARLAGKHPEFIRMSLKAGIGASAMEDFAEAISRDQFQYMLDNGDVPFQFRDGRNLRQIGTYLRRRLREELGYEKTETPRESLSKWKQEMLDLLRSNVRFEAHEPREIRKEKILKFFLDRDRQKLRNMKSRSAVFAQKKTL